MAILFTDGFDNYGTTTGTNLLTRWAAGTNPNSFSSSVTPYGYGQSLYAFWAASAYASVSFTATSTITVGTAFYISDVNPQGLGYPPIGLLSGTTWMVGLSIQSDGSIVVSRYTSATGATTLATSAAGIFRTFKWNYIELSVTISDTVGTVRVDVNGQTVINATGLDTRNGTPTTVNTLYLGSNGVTNTGTYYDDLYVSDSITPLGPQRIYILRPNADTAEKDWTATAGWQPFSGTTASSSAFATKGNIFTAAGNVSLTGVSVSCTAVAQTVRLGIAQLSSANPGTVSSVLYNSSPVVRTATAGFQTFTFPAVSFTTGNVYAIYLTRTDGTGTAALGVTSSATQDSADPTGSLNYNGIIIIADNDITGSENLFSSSSAGYTMILTYSGLPNYNSIADPSDTDADTSYVTASTVGDFDLYDVEAYPPASANIKAVNQIAWARKTDATARTMNLTTKSGATTTDSTAITLSASYAGYSRIYDTDPNTASAWTVSGVNALQIGQKVAS